MTFAPSYSAVFTIIKVFDAVFLVLLHHKGCLFVIFTLKGILSIFGHR